MVEYLSPKLDVVAKMIFERNTALLGDLLLSILDIPGGIEKITILNPFAMIDEPSEKKSIMDVKVELKSGDSSNVEFQICRANLEIQAREIPEIIPRLHYYKARMVTEQLKSGDSYKKIVPIRCVAVLDFEMYDDAVCHHAFRFYDQKHDMAFSQLEEIHIVEIPKLDQDKSNQQLWHWLKFFNAKEKEEFDMLSNQSAVMQQAVGVLASLSADEKARMIAEAREKELRDQMSRERGARAEGHIEGRAEGLAEGRMEGRIEIARKLIKKGLSIADVADTTTLSVSEIEKLLQ